MSRHLVCVAIGLLAALPAFGCGSLEQSLVFHPHQFPKGNWQLDDVPHEDASFLSEDGTRLHGWFAAAPNPRAVVLYCHGNAGNVTNCDWVLALFTERLNCSILVFDYRGYGKSEGSPSEAGLLADARAARRWLAARSGVAEGDIVLVGRSLGGAVAVDLAAKDGARALVLENTFTSLPDLAEHKAGLIPVRWLVEMQLNSVDLIHNYRGPLLQAHGDADRLVPYEQGYRLFMTANHPKIFVKAPERGHNDLPTLEYIDILDRFLANPPSQSASAFLPTTR